MSAQHWEARQRQRALEYREEKRRAAMAETEADAATDSGLDSRYYLLLKIEKIL